MDYGTAYDPTSHLLVESFNQGTQIIGQAPGGYSSAGELWDDTSAVQANQYITLASGGLNPTGTTVNLESCGIRVGDWTHMAGEIRINTSTASARLAFNTNVSAPNMAGPDPLVLLQIDRSANALRTQLMVWDGATPDFPADSDGNSGLLDVANNPANSQFFGYHIQRDGADLVTEVAGQTRRWVGYNAAPGNTYPYIAIAMDNILITVKNLYVW